MLSGQSDKQIPSKPNKNLTEAYKTVLTERTAFYAKDIAAGEEIPSIEGLKSLGTVEKPQEEEKIKHTIASLSVYPALEKAMSSEVSGWGAIKGVNLDHVSKDFIASGVSGSDLEKITNNRAKLTGFEEATKTAEVFNMVEVIAGDIKSKIPVEATPEALGLIFKAVFNEEGTIAGTAVGKGELAISLFTNCSKGKTGDLSTPSGKTIEVKGAGGRLGPAEYSQANAARDLVLFMKARNQKGSASMNRELVRLKTDVRKHSLKLEADERYTAIFTDKLKQSLNYVADQIDNPDIFQILEKNGFSQKYSINDTDGPWNAFNKLGYVHPKQVPAAPMEKSYVKDVQNSIRHFILNSKDGILKKGRLDRIAGKSVDIESLTNQSFTVAVQNFFLNDLGLTSDEAAEAFLSIKSYNRDVSGYLPEIKHFFQQHYSKMIEGDSLYLKAAVFGFQLAMYAQAGEKGQHFDYFMIMNNSSMNALSLDVAREHLFTYLANSFINNSSKIDLSIRADGRQGASAVTLK